ncbi:MAG: (E)-4-hydroxy-3-methylbut-2-enyl-diphosphate synthase [Elusimicrobiota bacterium]
MEAAPALSLPFCENLFAYRRRKTRVVMVGDVAVGGDNPLRLQSMTTTRTSDTDATVAQAVRLASAGCEIVRITAPTELDAKNLKNIKAALLAKGIKVPLVADIHFRPEAALEAAEHVEKVRVNPGNFADSKAFKIKEYSDAQYAEELERIEERFTPLALKLKRLGRALRIGTNHGSLSDRIMNRYGDTPEGMVESALEFVRICEKNGFRDIILSMKASNPKVMIAAYRLLAARMAAENMDYPFHLGVTEAGDGEDGRIKSAIGIGSILEDGIGDTVRVSLTEEPELEIPVARRIAARYDGRRTPVFFKTPLEPCRDLVHADNFYHYSRRPSRETAVGPIRLGGEQTVRTVNSVSRLKLPAPVLLAVLEEKLKSSRTIPPEILEWTVAGAADLEALRVFRRSLQFETSRLGYLARLAGPAPEGLWDAADGVVYSPGAAEASARNGKFLDGLKRAAADAEETGKPLFLEASDAEDLLEWGHAAAAVTQNLVLTLRPAEGPDADETARLIRQFRYVASQAWVKAGRFPLHLQAPPAADPEERVIRDSILFGSLLCDGLGDSVQAEGAGDLGRDLELVSNILQGAGARITKTEYVSCPSCGRTLFDLQSTTERIKKKTGHLKNVKIAIMGCIVNGPGEMADADFGYVGGGPDKINLYVGRECVEKGIPFERADEKLVELIRQHGKWTEPA